MPSYIRKLSLIVRSSLGSGTVDDVSGNPPDIRINAIARMPAHAPTINATTSHQNETIALPPRLFQSRRDVRPDYAAQSTQWHGRLNCCELHCVRTNSKKGGVAQAEPLYFIASHGMQKASRSIPTQSPPSLILNHPRLKKVFLLLEIDHLSHPRERVVGLLE